MKLALKDPAHIAATMETFINTTYKTSVETLTVDLITLKGEWELLVFRTNPAISAAARDLHFCMPPADRKFDKVEDVWDDTVERVGIDPMWLIDWIQVINRNGGTAQYTCARESYHCGNKEWSFVLQHPAYPFVVTNRNAKIAGVGLARH